MSIPSTTDPPAPSATPHRGLHFCLGASVRSGLRSGTKLALIEHKDPLKRSQACSKLVSASADARASPNKVFILPASPTLGDLYFQRKLLLIETLVDP